MPSRWKWAFGVLGLLLLGACNADPRPASSPTSVSSTTAPGSATHLRQRCFYIRDRATNDGTVVTSVTSPPVCVTVTAKPRP